MTVANDYKKDFGDDEIGEIERKYRMIINQNTMSYEIISRILSDFRNAKKAQKMFVADCWGEYLDIVDVIDADDSVKETLVKIILYKILTQREYIRDIKRGVNL